MTTTTHLYRHYDKKGTLLYVGIAANVSRRTAAHNRISPWAKDILRTTSEQYPTRIKAAIAELQAIDREKPLYNVVPGRERKRKLDDAVMFAVRVPAQLLRDVDAACKKEKITRSDFMRRLLEKARKRLLT